MAQITQYVVPLDGRSSRRSPRTHPQVCLASDAPGFDANEGGVVDHWYGSILVTTRHCLTHPRLGLAAALNFTQEDFVEMSIVHKYELYYAVEREYKLTTYQRAVEEWDKKQKGARPKVVARAVTQQYLASQGITMANDDTRLVRCSCFIHIRASSYSLFTGSAHLYRPCLSLPRR